MRCRAGANELALHVTQRAAIEAELDDAGADFRAVDALREFPYPACGQRFDGIVTHVLREKSIVEGGVVAGGGENVQSARLRQFEQQPGIAPKTHRGCIDEAAAAERGDALQVRQHAPNHFLPIVGLRCAHPFLVRLEVGQGMLVGQRQTEIARRHPAAHRHDPLASRLRAGWHTHRDASDRSAGQDLKKSSAIHGTILLARIRTLQRGGDFKMPRRKAIPDRRIRAPRRHLDQDAAFLRRDRIAPA